MEITFQLRLLDAERRVLAWNRLVGVTHGDGAIWPTQHFVAEGNATGRATDLCIAWPDLNFHTTVPLPGPVEVQAGKVVTVPLVQPLLRVPSDDRPLPPVVVGSSVTVSVPSGSLSGVGVGT